MSQRVSEKGFRRKTSVSGRPTPLFLLSHGSSVPSGVHTITETPNQQCAQEGDNFSATAGKGGTLWKNKIEMKMASFRLDTLVRMFTGPTRKTVFPTWRSVFNNSYSKNLGPTDICSAMFEI